MFCLGHKNFYGHSHIVTDHSKMFLYYKLIFFFICVVIFSTTAEEYEHSDTEIAKSDDRKSVFIGLIEITISLIGSTSAVMDIWDLSMALAFAVTSASVGLLMFLVSYHTSSTTQRKTKHQQVYYRKSPRKDVHGTQNCTLTQVSATTSVLTSRREKKEQSGLFSGGFVS